jgi:hypothetical protein
MHLHLLWPGHLQAHPGCLPPGPTDPDGKPAPGTQSSNFTFWPRRRQGGQQVKRAEVVTLEQHLGDGARSAEIAVDLEHFGVRGGKQIRGYILL